MEISGVEAAVCIRALKLAARWEARQGGWDEAEAFRAVRAELFARYCEGSPAPSTADEVEAFGFDPGGRFSDDDPLLARWRGSEG